MDMATHSNSWSWVGVHTREKATCVGARFHDETVALISNFKLTNIFIENNNKCKQEPVITTLFA